MIDPPKKMAVLYILEILKRETNEDHRISQKDLLSKLENDYDMRLERKSITRHINDLIDAGYDIISDNGYYLATREFENSELRLIIDSLLFSKNIPQKQCKELIKKLLSFSDRYFDASVKHITTLPARKTDNGQIFYTIGILDEAITQKKKVSFYYTEYRTDKKPHRKRAERYVVNPYQIAATNSRYYLICSTDKHDNISHYRLDHMEGAEILEETARPIQEITGQEYGLDLPKHMAEHIYMFSGESKRVTFRADLKIVDQIIDWFGTDITFTNETDTTVDASVIVNEAAMFCWLLQYGSNVEVLSPQSLRNRMKATVADMAEKYQI